MGRPVAELNLTAREAMEWAAFERAHGPMLPGERIEGMLAILCSLIANIHSDGRRFTPQDFLPQWDPDAEPEGQSPEDMLAFMNGILERTKTPDHDR